MSCVGPHVTVIEWSEDEVDERDFNVIVYMSDPLSTGNLVLSPPGTTAYCEEEDIPF